MSEHKFVRDNNSKAVLNTDTSALEQYKIAREQKMKEQFPDLPQTNTSLPAEKNKLERLFE